MDEILLEYSSEIRTGGLPGMSVLSKLIHLGGLCMSLTHATTPMSGYEHVMSHYLDLTNEMAGRPLAVHGSLVAVSTLVCSQVYRFFLEDFNPQDVRPDECFPDMARMHQGVLESISQVDPSGKAGEECWRDYQLLLERWSEQRTSLDKFLSDWPEIKVDLQNLSRPPEVIRKIMQEVGSPLRFAELTPPVSMQDARSAFLNAPFTRRRLTLGDLLIFLNWDRQSLWERVSANV
jgi:glycerol-1-phosphate dehydrogenase [NAD(P)+]